MSYNVNMNMNMNMNMNIHKTLTACLIHLHSQPQSIVVNSSHLLMLSSSVVPDQQHSSAMPDQVENRGRVALPASRAVSPTP